MQKTVLFSYVRPQEMANELMNKRGGSTFTMKKTAGQSLNDKMSRGAHLGTLPHHEAFAGNP